MKSLDVEEPLALLFAPKVEDTLGGRKRKKFEPKKKKVENGLETEEATEGTGMGIISVGAASLYLPPPQP